MDHDNWVGGWGLGAYRVSYMCNLDLGIILKALTDWIYPSSRVVLCNDVVFILLCILLQYSFSLILM